MKALVGFEFSGKVREALKKKGWDAWSCDLLPTDIPGQHYEGDIMGALNIQKWDLIILHTPCTKIALCGNSTYGKGMPKHSERIEAIKWTKLVWDTACSLCDHVAFENPKNVMGAYIGKRTQAIQPYEYGHLERKETWLWLKGLPLLRETNNVYIEMMKLPKKERERLHYMSPKESRGHERSITFDGIANAIADQWSAALSNPISSKEDEKFTQDYIDKNYISKYEYNKIWGALAESQSEITSLKAGNTWSDAEVYDFGGKIYGALVDPYTKEESWRGLEAHFKEYKIQKGRL